MWATRRSPAHSPRQTRSRWKSLRRFLELARKYAPFTGDDVNRIERPGGKRDWSALRSTVNERTRGIRSALEKDRGERMANSNQSIIG